MTGELILSQDRPLGDNKRLNRGRLSWTDVYVLQNVGLNIIDAANALHALQAKWFVKALQLGQSNLQTLLRHYVLQTCPKAKGNWPTHPCWIFTPNFEMRCGSRASDRVAQSWKQIAKHLRLVASKNHEEVLSTHL